MVTTHNKTSDNDIVVTEFMVTDSGIGISQQEQELLFKPFGQVNTSYSRGFTGKKEEKK